METLNSRLDGCSFEAHALVVTKHIRMQHEGDLFSKLKNLSTPEDIQKWREERRKNYPTFGKKQEKEDTARERKERREICDRSAPLFRYRIENYHDNSFECDEYLKQVQYRQGTNWMSRMFAPDPKKRSVKVPFASMNKSRTVTLESFYMSCKVKEGRIIKNTKVRWKGFQSKKLQKLEDSEDEGDSTEIPISDEEDNETVEKPKGLMLVDYSSEEEGEIEEEEAKVVVFPSLDGEDDCEEKTFRIQEFSEDAAFKKTPVWGRKEVPTKRTWMKNKLLETVSLKNNQIWIFWNFIWNYLKAK